MYLQALANRVPPASFSQKELWEIYRNSRLLDQLTPRSIWIVEKVLTGDNGIEKRHFALSDLEKLPSLDAESQNRAFEKEAPKLASQALREALDKAQLKANELDALIVCTCTGYLCPGVSSHVAEQTGLRSDAFLLDLVGLGCGALVPSLRNAAGLIAGNPSARVAVVAVEICSAALYLDDDPGVLISACLFGDGASASIWNGAPNAGPGLRAFDFDTLHQPENREILRFENRKGKLRNRLHHSVPIRAAKAVKFLLERSRARCERPIQQVITHTGGRDVLQAIENEIPELDLSPSKSALRNFGNMSSPSIFFALEAFLDNQRISKDQDLWLCSFGAGFAAHSFRLARRE